MAYKGVYSIFILTVVIKLSSSSPIYNSRNVSIYPMDVLYLTTLGDHKYYFSDFRLTWMDSLTFCKNYGMDLVKVDTIEENFEIKSHLQTLPYAGSSAFFTSGTQMGQGETFHWADGTTINWIVQEWCPNEPNNGNGGNENCIIYYSSSFCWADATCGPFYASGTLKADWYYFICEEIVN